VNFRSSAALLRLSEFFLRHATVYIALPAWHVADCMLKSSRTQRNLHDIAETKIKVKLIFRIEGKLTHPSNATQKL
jgi:hypothetical protein